MKPAVLLCLVVACVVPALAQRPGQMRNSLGAIAVDRVAVGADDSGREALCEQIRLMSTRARDIPVLPENVELFCGGSDTTTFALRFQVAPTLTEKVICDVVGKPSSVVFYQMRPIALRRGSTVTPAQDLSEKLQPLGVTTVGRLLGSFGFVNLELRRGEAKEPFREIGLHEVHLLCQG